MGPLNPPAPFVSIATHEMLGQPNQPPMLTQGHVDRLLRDRSSVARAETAASVASAFAGGDLAPRERRIAESILGILAADVADEVRASLAEHLKHSPLLPRKLAVALAHDIETVALPILRVSEVFSDDDLIALVKAGNEAKQFAIAERRSVSEAVSHSLVETGRKGVICVLLANDGAIIGESSLEAALDRYQDDEGVTALMVDRRELPLAITERLISSLSETLRERLIQRHKLPEPLADDISLHGRERALSRLVTDESKVVEIEALVERLFATGKLTPTLLLRSICVGDLHFFEAGMARLAGMPIENARTLLYDRGPLGYRGLYSKTGLPSELFRAFRVAIDVVREVRTEEAPGRGVSVDWSRSCTDMIVDRLVREYRQICPADVEHVLSQLARQFADSPVAMGKLTIV